MEDASQQEGGWDSPRGKAAVGLDAVRRWGCYLATEKKEAFGETEASLMGFK